MNTNTDTDFAAAVTTARDCGAECARAYGCGNSIPEWTGEPILPGDWDAIEESLGCDPSNLDSVDNQELIDAWLAGYETERSCTTKKAIVQLSTAILGIGATLEEALDDAQRYTEITREDLVSPRGACAGDCVCVEITDDLAANSSTDYWEVENGVAVATDPSEYTHD